MPTVEEQIAIAEAESRSLELEAKARAVQEQKSAPAADAGGTPHINSPGEMLTEAGKFGKDVASRVGNSAVDMAKGVVNAPGHIANAVIDRIDNPDKANPSVDPAGMGMPLWNEYTKGMTDDQKVALAIKLGLGTALGVAGAEVGGVAADAAAPYFTSFGEAAGGAAGSAVGADVAGSAATEAAGLEPPTSTRDKLVKASADTILTGVIPAAGKVLSGAKSVLGSARKFIRDAGGYPDFANAELWGKQKIAKLHGVGLRQTPSGDEWSKEMVAGADKWMKVNPAKGTDNWIDYGKNQQKVLDDSMKTVDAIVQKADNAVKTNRGSDKAVPLISLHDVEQAADKTFGAQTQKLSIERNSKIAGDFAVDREAAINAARADFNQQVPNMVPGSNMQAVGTHTITKYLTPGEAAQKLKLTYQKLRELREFDDSVAGKQASDPSIAAKNRVEREVYSAYATALKESLRSNLNRLAIRKLIPAADAKAFTDALDTFHAIKPYQDAVTTLVNRIEVGGSTMGAGSLRNVADKGVARPFIDRSPIGAMSRNLANANSAAVPEKTFGDLQSTIPIAAGDGQMAGEQAIAGGLSQGIEAPLGAAGAGLQALPPQAIVGATLFDHPEIIQSYPNPQVQAALEEASRAGTPEQKRKAIGMAQIDSAINGAGMFEPSPIPGVLSFQPDGKGGGYISDDQERALIVGQVEKIYRTDTLKRLELKRALFRDGHLPYIPDELKQATATGQSPTEAPRPPNASLTSKVAGRLKTARVDGGAQRVDPGY